MKRDDESETPGGGAVAAAADDVFGDKPMLISAETFNVLASADSILEQARVEALEKIAAAEQQAHAIRELAQADAEAIRRRARAEGISEAQRQLSSKITDEQTHRARSIADLDERIGMIVTRTLSKVIGESERDEQFFTQAIRRVLSAVRGEKLLTIRVKPAQLGAAEKAVDAAVALVDAEHFIEVVPDASLRTGACLVESPHGVVDAGLDTQLETIRRALTTIWTHPDDRSKI